VRLAAQVRERADADGVDVQNGSQSAADKK